MSPEASATDRTMRPTVIIGLGGTGHEVLKSIRRRMVQRYNDVRSLPFVRFLQIDTDQEMRSESVPEGHYLEASLAFEASELVPLLVPNPAQVRSSPAISPWFPADLTVDLDFRMGAAGKRNFGRMALAANLDVVYERIQAAIRSARDSTVLTTFQRQRADIVVDGTSLFVFVVCSLVGGTGSGGFLDLCYLIRKYLMPQQGGTLFGFFVVGGRDADAIKKANSYGALQELEYFSRPATRFASAYPGRTIQRIDDANPPVDLCYLIGNENSAGMPFDRLAIFDLVAEEMFLEMTPGLGAKKRSLRADLGGAHGYKNLDRFGAPQSFLTFGVASIEFPAPNILELFTLRLAAETLGGWTFPKANSIAAVKAVGADLQEWRLLPDALAETLGTIGGGGLLRSAVIQERTKKRAEVDVYVPGARREDLWGRVQNHVTSFEREVDTAPDRLGSWIRHVRHQYVQTLDEELAKLGARITTLVGNPETGGAKNALAYLAEFESKLRNNAEQHRRRSVQAEAAGVKHHAKAQDVQQRLQGDLRTGDDYMIRAHVDGLYASLASYQQARLETEINDRAALLLEGKQDEGGQWIVKGLLTDVQRLKARIEVDFTKRLEDLSAALHDQYQTGLTRLTSRQAAQDLLFERDDVEALYRKQAGNPYESAAHLKAEVETVLGGEAGPLPIFGAIADSPNQVRQALLDACRRRFYDVRDVSVAARLNRLSPDELATRVRSAYATSQVLLGLDETARAQACQYDPNKTRIQLLGVSTDDPDLTEEGSVIRAVRSLVSNPTLVRQLPDRYRFLFTDELGAFSLKCVPLFREYDQIAADQQRSNPDLHFTTDRQIEFPRLFPPDAAEVTGRVKPWLMLARALGLVQQHRDPQTHETTWYLPVRSVHGSDPPIRLGVSWPEVERTVQEQQVERETHGRLNEPTAGDRLAIQLEEIGKAAGTRQERERLWTRLEGYLESLRTELGPDGGLLHPRYIEEKKHIDRYRDLYRLTPPADQPTASSTGPVSVATTPAKGELQERHCPSCGEKVLAEWTGCAACGAELPTTVEACPKCGRPTKAGWRFCVFCRTSLT